MLGFYIATTSLNDNDNIVFLITIQLFYELKTQNQRVFKF